MVGTGEDNSSVGQTHAHPKADLAQHRFVGARPSVVGRIMLAVLCGAFVGYLLGIVIAPFLAFALAIAGAMMFGAGAVALMLFKPAPPDEYASGKARTEEEVRKALAEIEARKR